MAPAITRVGSGLFWFLCLAVGLVSLRILVLGMEVGYPAMMEQAARAGVFWAHVVAASVALILLPFQFWMRLRTRRPQVHRWVGRSYVVACFVGGVSGAILAPFAETGLAAGSGFFLLALAWLFTTARGFLLARARKFAEHKRWMMRSAALTFAAVTLRIYLPLSFATQIPFEMAYPVIAWMCWVPNILVMEWWLRRDVAALPVCPFQ